MVVCTQHPALWQSSSHPVPQSRTLTLCFLFFLGFQILIILKENFISVMMSFPIFLPLMSGSGSSFLSQDLSAVGVPCLWTCTGFNILCLMALVIVGDGIWYVGRYFVHVHMEARHGHVEYFSLVMLCL